MTGDVRVTDEAGRVAEESHLDPQGIDVGAADPAQAPGDPDPSAQPAAGAYGALLPHWMGGSGKCMLDGMQVGCALATSLYEMGAAVEPEEYTVIMRRRPIHLDPPPVPAVPKGASAGYLRDRICLPWNYFLTIFLLRSEVNSTL